MKFATVYVSLFRAKTLDSVAILCFFDKETLHTQPHQDLTAEMKRLGEIVEKTKEMYEKQPEKYKKY